MLTTEEVLVAHDPRHPALRHRPLVEWMRQLGDVGPGLELLEVRIHVDLDYRRDPVLRQLRAIVGDHYPHDRTWGRWFDPASGQHVELDLPILPPPEVLPTDWHDQLDRWAGLADLVTCRPTA